MQTRAAAVLPLVALFAAGLAGCAATASVPPGGTPAATASQPTIGQEIGAVADNKIVVTFPTGGAALTAGANRQLDLAARLYRDASPVAMFTTGHTDRVGPEFANVMLSARRAQVVKNGLVARGIPADRLLIQALGASELANPSDPVAAENRRVVITWRLI